MDIDRYTRLVLTVIAASLFWLAFGPLLRVEPARADGIEPAASVDVNIVAIDGHPVFGSPIAIPVTIQQDPAPGS